MKYLAITLIIPLILMFSCSYNNEEELYPDENCDTTNVTYTIDVKPIFEQSCYSCHSNSADPLQANLNLEDFDHIQRVVDDGALLRNIKHEPDGTPMPQGGGKLSDCKILKIENWINQGIPNN